MLTARAPAKVNLYLHVGPVKPNGRHDLDSLVVFADGEAADTLTVTAAPVLGIEVNGPQGQNAGPVGDNLVLKAAQALKDAAGVGEGAFFRLTKRLPVAAGIGGGSSDAAAALKLLTRLWRIDPAHAVRVAPALGGDVPVGLAGVPALMQGEGERVAPVPLPARLPALLANPGIACPTGPVFGAYDAAGGGAGFAEAGPFPNFSTPGDLAGWLTWQRNDLEAPAIQLVPEIGRLLDWLAGRPGASLARMSGSGATCFALFADQRAARAAARAFARDWRDDWPKGWAAACTLGDAS